MKHDSQDTEELVRRTGAGDFNALEELFSRHRERLRRMVRLRLDPRLSSRVDDSDVLQDVHLEAVRRLPAYLRDPQMPFFLWLRSITGQKLVDLHRHYFGAKSRDRRREVSLHRGPMPDATSAVVAAHLLGTMTTASRAIIKAELKLRVQEALNSMDPKDREVLVLRHFEHLSNVETARELDIEISAASKRYIRALRRLKNLLASMPGGLGEL